MEAHSEFSVAYYSDKGSVKKDNQDSIAVKCMGFTEGDLLWCGLFDGMGGLSYGEQASNAAARWSGEWVRTQAERIRSAETEPLCEELAALHERMSAKLADFGRRKGAELGTTAVDLLLYAGRFLCWNVGDSRAYRFRKGEVTQLSEDHNLAFELAAAGVLTAEQARSDPRRSVLTQALGQGEKLIPAFYADAYAPGDRFLLCCDGFYHTLEESELGTALTDCASDEKEMQRALETLAKTAVSRGETDNISAILIAVNRKGER